MKAFSLLELIFVIVIIGIMAGLGSASIKTNHLLNDSHYIVGKIREAQYKGIGYEHNGFGTESTVPDYKRGCIALTPAFLDGNASKAEAKYSLHVNINHSALGTDTLCFDTKGRPHDGDFTQNTLFTEQKVLILTYKTKNVTISIEPITGYAIIN